MLPRLQLIVLFVSFATVRSQFDSTSCGVTKGCLFAPPNCTPGQNCEIMFSYLENGDFLDIELSGAVATDGYVAVGFSTDQAMGDDTVVYCSATGDNVQAGLAYNTGKSTPTILDSSQVQTVNSVSKNNGNAYCNVRQRLQSNMNNVKNLNDVYYILLAGGPTSNGALSYHQTNRHVLPRTDLTAYKRDTNGQVVINGGNPLTQQNDDTSRSTADKLMIAHGILMTLSWSVFLATGILFARHFRGHWPDTTILGVKMWFHFHRTLNMIGIGGTICGFVMVFVAKDWRWVGPTAGEPSELNRRWGSVHAMLGLVACVVAWAQPLNAVFRCGPDQKGRFIFNWIHRILGFGSWLAAAAAIMIAVVHFNGMFSNRDAALGLYIAFICVIGLTFIAMEVLSLKTWWSGRDRVGTEMEMVRMGGVSVVQSDETNRVQKLQLLLLLIFVVISIGLSVAISVLIGVKPKA